MPGYWFIYNFYALARNASKYIDRDKRITKSPIYEYAYLAPDTVNELLKAKKIIATAVAKASLLKQKDTTVYTDDKLALIGDKILSTQTKKEVDSLIEKGDKKEIAIMHIIQKYIVESKKVLFEGDGYSEEWHHEAERRGLQNVPTTPLALDALSTDKAKILFENNGVYNHIELEARHEIELENYIKKVQIEARIIGDLALNHIIPSAIKYQNTLTANIKGLKEAGLPESAYETQMSILKEISDHVQVIYAKVHALVEARKIANNITSTRTKAITYESQVKAAFYYHG
jgi:glutamine synthetase type III